MLRLAWHLWVGNLSDLLVVVWVERLAVIDLAAYCVRDCLLHRYAQTLWLGLSVYEAALVRLVHHRHLVEWLVGTGVRVVYNGLVVRHDGGGGAGGGGIMLKVWVVD